MLGYIVDSNILLQFSKGRFNKKQTCEKEPFVKIAFVTDAYNYGRGGDVATIRMAEGLKKRGYEITVVAARSVQQERFFQVKGFYPPGTKESFTKGDYIWGVPEKKILRKAFSDVDLIQVQHPFVLGYGAVKVAKAMGKPVIGAFHAQPQNVLGMMEIGRASCRERV